MDRGATFRTSMKPQPPQRIERMENHFAKINKTVEVELHSGDVSYAFCQLSDAHKRFFLSSLVDEELISEETYEILLKEMNLVD